MKNQNNLTIIEYLNLYCPESWREIFYEARLELQDVSEVIERFKNNGSVIIPSINDLFNPFVYCPVNNVKVVIFDVKPINHSFNSKGVKEFKSDGIAFSTKINYNPLDTILNIYQEISNNDPNFIIPDHGNLIPWLKQGVLLLNSQFTTEYTRNNNHDIIWHGFIQRVLNNINKINNKCVYVIWGNELKIIKNLIPPKSYILETFHHPSSKFNSSFNGCNHFNLINEYLIKNNIKPIDWTIPKRSTK